MCQHLFSTGHKVVACLSNNWSQQLIFISSGVTIALVACWAQCVLPSDVQTKLQATFKNRKFCLLLCSGVLDQWLKALTQELWRSTRHFLWSSGGDVELLCCFYWSHLLHRPHEMVSTHISVFSLQRGKVFSASYRIIDFSVWSPGVQTANICCDC